MQRRDALKAMAAGLATTSVLGGTARGSFQDPSKDISLPEMMRNIGPMMDSIPIEANSLGGGLSMISGPGGNVAALVGPDGVVVVDAFVPNRGADLASMVRKLAAGPITLINTHWHFDHTGGNAALAGIGARIVAHKAVRPRLSTDQYNADFQLKIPPSPAAAWPVVSLGDSTTMFLNGEEIELTHVAPAHTDGDLFLHFRKANVLHTGDLYSNGIFPNIDSSSEGWIGGMIAATDVLLGVVDAKTRIIPGHGPLATRDDLKATRSMYVEVRDKVQPLVESGKTVEEAVAARPLADLEARWGKGFFRGSHFTRIVYSGLAMHRGAK